jgi:cytochrome c553
MKKITILIAILGSIQINAGDFETQCASCHGAKGEKSALGKSKIIKDMSKSEIKAALIGYQKGTYGGAMKALMQGNVKKLNSAQIGTIANQIGK